MQYEESRIGDVVESPSIEAGPQPWQARRERPRIDREPLVMAPWRGQWVGVNRRRSGRNPEPSEPASVGALT